MRTALLVFLTATCAMAQDDTQKLHTLFDTVYKTVLQQSPETATAYGIPGENDRWTDMSPEGIAGERKMFESFRAGLKGIQRDRLSATDQLNYDILERYAAVHIEQQEFQLSFLTTNQMMGIHLQISNAFDR